MLVAVTGANGWVGRKTSDYLAAAGQTVRRIVRTQQSPGDHVWDARASDFESLKKALEGCDVAVHCAARVHHDSDSPGESEVARQINVEGTRQVIEACKSGRVPRLLFVSTMAIYRWNNGLAVNEDSPVDASTSYAQSKLQAEELVRHSGIDWRIARLATVYGEGDRANFMRLADALKRRRFFVPGAGTAQKSVIPIHRAAELISKFALRTGTATGLYRVVNLASDQVPTLAEICDAFCGVCGFKRPPHVPLLLCRFMALVGDFMRGLGRDVPFHTNVLKKLVLSTRIDISRQKELFPELMWPDFRDELTRCRGYYSKGLAAIQDKLS